VPMLRLTLAREKQVFNGGFGVVSGIVQCKDVFASKIRETICFVRCQLQLLLKIVKLWLRKLCRDV
jgi:hypothetical protein